MSFKIYTKTGDKGQTGLFGGARVAKNHIRVEAYGTVDELNSYIALLNDLAVERNIRSYTEILKEIQDRLFTIGANLASDPNKNMSVPDVLAADVELLEQAIDEMEKNLPALKHFILPGGHPLVSHCNIARTVCRRAERCIVSLNKKSSVEPLVIQYVNRLSDYLFVLGRMFAHLLQVEEVKWFPRAVAD
jgi:cob(I)alamin adenosyltransferase